MPSEPQPPRSSLTFIRISRFVTKWLLDAMSTLVVDTFRFL